MSFRDQIKKGGGGFLNGVSGTLVGYEFTDRFKGEKEAGEWVYLVPSIMLDGADEPVDQHLFMGAAERYVISKDKQSITMADDSNVFIGGTTPTGLFLSTAVDKDTDDAFTSQLPDLSAGEPLELSAMVGQRFTFKQEVDEEGTRKRGKRVVGTGKDKKEYNRTNTVIDAVLGAPASGGRGKGAAAAIGKKSKTVDLDAEAVTILSDILESAKLPVTRKGLALPVTKALMGNDNRDALKALILDEDWQEANGFEVDKKGILSVA